MAVDLRKDIGLIGRFLKFLTTWRGVILGLIGLFNAQSREQQKNKRIGICQCVSVDVVIAGNKKCQCKRY